LRFNSTLSCRFLGEKSSVCLEFHHRDPSEKKSAAANLVRDKRLISEGQAEIAKRIVVCRNCLAKMHAGTISNNQAEEMIVRD
jgi:hypothetical protein